jgi:hypothetical protein
MAWTPSPEVAVARDAAKKLGNASMCIVLWIDEQGEHVGCASYGKTQTLCREAKGIGDAVYQKTLDYIAAFG